MCELVYEFITQLKNEKATKTYERCFSFWEARITPITNYKWKCKEYSMVESCSYITLYNNFKWVWKNPGLGSDASWDWKHSVLCVHSRLGPSCIMWEASQSKADEEVQLCTVLLSSSCLHHCSAILQNGHQKFFMTRKNRYCVLPQLSVNFQTCILWHGYRG